MRRQWPAEDLQLAPWLGGLAVSPGNDWQQHPPDPFPPYFASSWGHDVYGLWYVFSVNGVEQCMRWIPPGVFLRGSPESEPDREDDERQHSVMLSCGFWLADTACTQALWNAVTAERSSEFQGEQLPVENISWLDAAEFCELLNQSFPGFGACLPSEAQWEYACRAGTTTAFWWGDAQSVVHAKYDGDRSYAHERQGQSAENTVEVTRFVPNPWGLYQMHGNVNEWCRDWYGDYPDGPAVDPVGPALGDCRVVRGGSWASYGRWLRAAIRLNVPPDYSDEIIGFRLAQFPDGEAVP